MHFILYLKSFQINNDLYGPYKLFFTFINKFYNIIFTLIILYVSCRQNFTVSSAKLIFATHALQVFAQVKQILKKLFIYLIEKCSFLSRTQRSVDWTSNISLPIPSSYFLIIPHSIIVLRLRL